jgi:hypothetical protein
LLSHEEALLGAAAPGIQFCDFKDEHPGLCIPSDQADVPASVTFAQDFHGPRIETCRLLRSGTGKVMELPRLSIEKQNRAERRRPAIFRNRVDREYLSARVILDAHRENLRAGTPGEC